MLDRLDTIHEESFWLMWEPDLFSSKSVWSFTSGYSEGFDFRAIIIHPPSFVAYSTSYIAQLMIGLAND